MAGQLLKVCIIEDQDADAETLYRHLTRSLGFEVDVVRACDRESALTELARHEVDVIFLDYNLGPDTGLETLNDIRETGDLRPVVILTGQADTYIVAELLRAGADEYLAKNDLGPKTLERAMQIAQSQHRRRVAEVRNQQLIKDLAGQNREILHLAYAMTHDLQTPLASVTGTVDSLRNHLDIEQDAQTTKWLDRIDESVGRMTTMLDHLMVYARAGEEELNTIPVDVEALINDILDELELTGTTKRVHVMRPVPSIVGDPEQLSRVFSNLIGNAFKYTDANGRIDITAAHVPGAIRYVIADNGPGIDPRKLDEVFLPFKRATSSVPGTGLGLATVHRIVRRHGGKVWFESDGCSGTTVFVEFPTESAPRSTHNETNALVGVQVT